MSTRSLLPSGRAAPPDKGQGMNNTNSGPPLAMKITGGGAWIPPARGITLVTRSPMNDAADLEADNGHTVIELNELQHFMAAVDGATPPPSRANMTDGVAVVVVDGSSETVPALPLFGNENNDAGININKVIGNVSLVDAGVEYKVQCLGEESILGARTPQTNFHQE